MCHSLIKDVDIYNFNLENLVARKSSKNVEQEGFWDLNKIEAMLTSDSSQEIEPTARRSSKNVEQEVFWDLNKIEAMLTSDSSQEIEPKVGGSSTNVEQDYSWDFNKLETMSMPVSYVGNGEEDNSGIPETVDSWVDQLLEGLITPKKFCPSQ
ncbi:Uncharacterized protein Fot_22691 [Forsythia ovata]|uniref:Uncharacterized protein n=1 Tax=Forsythia ovata TaxID=205694 RepID=A0ABD1V089_9LAMI